MRLGFSLPQYGPHTTQFAKLPQYARDLEQLGAASLWVSDRVLAPVTPTVNYPGTDHIPTEFHAILDPLALMSAIGAVTTRAEIGVNVLVAPWYPPILLARMLTTIDIITAGRLVPGFGLGWSPEEYVATGVPMTQRGRRLNECLDILDRYWTQNPVEYTGEYWTIPATHVALKPVRKPPVHLAAMSPAAFDRVARRADGWLPVAIPGHPLDHVNQGLEALQAAAEKADRDPATINVILRLNVLPDTTTDNIVTAVDHADKLGITHVLVAGTRATASPEEGIELAQRVLDHHR